MSCQEVRDLFPRLKTLDAEKRGRVRGHLKRCKECFSVLVEALKDENRFVRSAAAEALGELQDPRAIAPLCEALKHEDGDVREAAAQALLEEKTPPASLLQSARKVVSAYLIARRGVLGLIWEKVREVAAQGEAWAKEKLAEGQRWIEGAMMLWQMTPALAGGSGLSTPGMGATGIAAEVVDDTWQPQGKVVPFEVREGEGPVVTADGRFTFTLHTPEAQWQGAQAVCTLLLVEGQRVSFESVVQPAPSGQGGEVSFTAEGLPQGAEVPVPLELVQLYVVASDREAL
jgi:hypothetical protein